MKKLVVGCLLATTLVVQAGEIHVPERITQDRSYARQESPAERAGQQEKSLMQHAQEHIGRVIDTVKGHAVTLKNRVIGQKGSAPEVTKSATQAPQEGGLKVGGDVPSQGVVAQAREHAQRLWDKVTGKKSDTAFVANKGAGESTSDQQLDVATEKQGLQETKTVQDLQNKYKEGLFAIQNSGSVGDQGDKTLLTAINNVSQDGVVQGFKDLQKDLQSISKLGDRLGETVSDSQLSKKIAQRYADLSFALAIHNYTLPEDVDMASLHDAILNLYPDDRTVLQKVYSSRFEMLDKAYNDTQDQAATKIQKNVRGRQAREQVKNIREEAAAKADQDRKVKREEAAKTIQKNVRGKSARNEVAKIRQDRANKAAKENPRGALLGKSAGSTLFGDSPAVSRDLFGDGLGDLEANSKNMREKQQADERSFEYRQQLKSRATRFLPQAN